MNSVAVSTPHAGQADHARAAKGILVLREVCLPLCTFQGCGFAIQQEYLVRHLRELHRCNKDDAENALAAVKRELAELVLSPAETSMKAAYLAGDWDLSAPRRALPPIRMLPVVAGLACSCCSYVCRSANTLRKHVQHRHPERQRDSESLETQSHRMRIQSIFGGKKRKYFVVSGEEERNAVRAAYVYAIPD
jgi:hypothetical protein